MLKRFYARETIAAFNYEFSLNVLQTPLPFYATQIINPLLNSRISANHNKVDEFSANGVIFIKIVSLF